jgi:hypothetical protein
MTTFSQLVDRIAKEIVRPDMVEMLPAYLNQTIREIHLNAQTSMPVFYADNRIETQLTITSVDSETGAFVWAVPKPALLQRVEAVFYNRAHRYARESNPKTSMLRNQVLVNDKYSWYRVAQQLVFAGAGDSGDKISVSYFEYPRSLPYYAQAARPAYWDEIQQQYMIAAGQSPIDALDKTTNWILERHEELLAEGLRAKAYKRMADETRSRTSYSQYETMRLGVQNTESTEFNVGYER